MQRAGGGTEPLLLVGGIALPLPELQPGHSAHLQPQEVSSCFGLKHQRRGRSGGGSISSSQGMWFSSSHLIFGQETEMGIGKAAEPT